MKTIPQITQIIYRHLWMYVHMYAVVYALTPCLCRLVAFRCWWSSDCSDRLSRSCSTSLLSDPCSWENSAPALVRQLVYFIVTSQNHILCFLMFWNVWCIRWRVGVLHHQDGGGGTTRDSAAAGAVPDQLLHDGSAGSWISFPSPYYHCYYY